jgi:hypothetical protein
MMYEPAYDGSFGAKADIAGVVRQGQLMPQSGHAQPTDLANQLCVLGDQSSTPATSALDRCGRQRSETMSNRQTRLVEKNNFLFWSNS